MMTATTTKTPDHEAAIFNHKVQLETGPPLVHLTAALGMLMAWCTAGLVALSLSEILPSILSPVFVTLREPILWSTLMGIVGAGPIAHFAGALLLRSYRLWQPLRGGVSFICVQTIGWCLFALGLLVLGVDVLGRLCSASSKYCAFYDVCVTCHPVLLLSLALLTVLGNSLLLFSLHLYKPDHVASGLYPAKQGSCGVERPPSVDPVAVPSSFLEASSSQAPWPASTVQTVHRNWTLRLYVLLAAVGVMAFTCAPCGTFTPSPETINFLRRNVMVLSGLSLIAILNVHPVSLPPSQTLDCFGRINNLYQILAHLGVAVKFAGIPVEIYGAMDEQHQLDFQVMNVLDYAGWLAIFSRLDRVPWVPKTIANAHMATGMLSLLHHRQFQDEHIRSTPYLAWDSSRCAFVLIDAMVRSYYEFHALPAAACRKQQRKQD